MTRSLDPQLARMNQQTIKVRRAAATRDNYGKPTFDTAIEVDVRLVNKRTIVEGTLGRQVISNHSFVSETEILKTDAIFLPGDDPTDSSLARHPQDIQIGVNEFGDTTFWLVSF